MAQIAFRQFLLPHGREAIVHIDRPEEIAAKAEKITAKGLRFECEMLSGYSSVSLTITCPEKGDLAIEVVSNGPEVPIAVDRLIANFPV